MRTAFEREGAIRSVDLLAAFATLWTEKASGILDFTRPGETIRFEISDGDVLDVSASDPDFQAAAVLVRAGKLEKDALEGRLPKGEDPARAARDRGLITERDWRWGERIRVVEILSHLLSWLEGSYVFDEDARPEPGNRAASPVAPAPSDSPSPSPPPPRRPRRRSHRRPSSCPPPPGARSS